MSDVFIQQYLNELRDLRKVSGSNNESNLKDAFANLLRRYGRARDLTFVREYEIETPAKRRRYVDGALLHELRVPFGYWEAKDEKDDLNAEIAHKFKEGYPQDNILFEDSREAVLIQNGRLATPNYGPHCSATTGRNVPPKMSRAIPMYPSEGLGWDNSLGRWFIW